jgi:hypothetical protein
MSPLKDIGNDLRILQFETSKRWSTYIRTRQFAKASAMRYFYLNLKKFSLRMIVGRYGEFLPILISTQNRYMNELG